MHHSAMGASTMIWISIAPGNPPRNPPPPIQESGTSTNGQPGETTGTMNEPWPSSQLVVQYQIWSPPW